MIPRIKAERFLNKRHKKIYRIFTMKNTKGSAHFYKVKEGKSYITKIILEIKSSGQRAIYNGDIEKIILPTTRVSKLGG